MTASCNDWLNILREFKLTLIKTNIKSNVNSIKIFFFLQWLEQIVIFYYKKETVHK